MKYLVSTLVVLLLACQLQAWSWQEGNYGCKTWTKKLVNCVKRKIKLEFMPNCFSGNNTTGNNTTGNNTTDNNITGNNITGNNTTVNNTGNANNFANNPTTWLEQCKMKDTYMNGGSITFGSGLTELDCVAKCQQNDSCKGVSFSPGGGWCGGRTEITDQSGSPGVDSYRMDCEIAEEQELEEILELEEQEELAELEELEERGWYRQKHNMTWAERQEKRTNYLKFKWDRQRKREARCTRFDQLVSEKCTCPDLP